MANEQKKRPVVASPKKRFDPLKNNDLKPLSIKDFAEAINKVSSQSIMHNAVPKSKENLFQQKLLSLKKCLAYLMSLICLKI